ncbi:MAG TPA: mechanosensitive ion channel domain-containing protein [Acidobacteriota bacterium]|nr:mechanosensitive ion channel domain-containing protein [Acidobacteriota bacterium]
MKRALGIWLLIALLAPSLPLLYGQQRNPLQFLSQSEDEEKAPEGPSLQERSQELQRQLAQVRSRLRQEEEADSGAARQLSLLQQIESLLDQLRTQQNIVQDLESEKLQLEEDLRAMRDSGPPGERPFSFLRLSAVRSELRSHLRQGGMLQSARQALQEAVASARRQHQEKEAERRRVKELQENNSDAARIPELSRRLRLAELESWLALERLNLRRAELEARRISDEIYGMRSDYLRQQVAWIARETQFPEELLNQELAQIRVRQQDSAERQQQLRSQLEEARQQLREAENAEESGQEPPQSRRLEALRSRLDALQVKLKLENDFQSQLALQRRVWNRRREVFQGGVENGVLAEWRAESTQSVQQLEVDRQLDRLQADDVRHRLLTLQQQLQAVNEGSPAARALQAQIDNAQSLLEAYENAVLRIEDALRLLNGLQEEITLALGGEDLGQRLSRYWDNLVRIWYMELTSVDDKPITVAKVVGILLAFLLGLWVSRRISTMMGRRVLPRMGMDEGSSAAIQALFYYTLVLIFAIIALYAVNVPLTAFTVAGGAVAIGVGFGSQNVMRNFISGIILLTERPIRVGDLVQLDQIYGTIKRIGLRSTQVLSSDNVDIIVPNSTFLEQNVVNWTLSDDRYRAKVTVGVVYGSPTREVVRMIERAVSEHGKVLKTPHPIILFSEFGDNALIFEVHFWLRMRRLMDSRTIQSDLRHRIDTLFREAGITIAFPQRDVHLDSLSPIEVRIKRDRPSLSQENADGPSGSDPHTEPSDKK